ncbi:MAG: AAA family ATPase, partial [Myxococcales bacterium]|nr:AAA family ATPase [Myxococcales bacterium]
MRLLALGVRSFGCVEEAQLELGPGLNVLYGPNDLGKSTLARAIRAVLLLPSTHKEAELYRPWHRDAVPEVSLTFLAKEEAGSDREPRIWRVHKAFGGGRRSHADLWWSNDGQSFALEPTQKGAGVDDKLRAMLGWGVSEARARGTRGIPSSFLATVLLGPQAMPSSMLGLSLEDDPSETGRERLTEALQALAQDPRFKDVLDQAQRKVDEAFTPTGKRKKGKASPLSPIRQKIEGLGEELRQLEARVHESDAVRDQLVQLDAQRAEAIEARDEAETRWQRLHQAWQRSEQRQRAQAEVQQARDALEEARKVLGDRRTWQEAVQRHLRGRPAAEAALGRAREVEQAAAQSLADVEAVLRGIEEGGDAEAKLARQQLETRRLELRADEERINALLTQLERAQDLRVTVDELAEQRDALGHDLAAAERAASEAETARREAEADKRSYDAALRLRRWQEAQQRVRRAEQAEAEAEGLLAEAGTKEAEAEAIEAALQAEELPAADRLERWRVLAEERRVAEARLGVGLQVVVRGTTGALRASRDDGPPEAIAADEAIEAQRRMVLALGDGTEIEIRGGDPGARAARDELERRWGDEVVPTLQRLEVDDLAALRRRIDAAAERMGEARARRREAEGTRGLAAARREQA